MWHQAEGVVLKQRFHALFGFEALIVKPCQTKPQGRIPALSIFLSVLPPETRYR